jgi:hypothetical protein
MYYYDENFKQGDENKPWLWKVPADAKCIGKRRVRREDGYDKVSGRGKYLRDNIFLACCMLNLFYLHIPTLKSQVWILAKLRL